MLKHIPGILWFALFILVLCISPEIFFGLIIVAMIANAIFGSSTDTKGGEPRDGGGV